MYKIAALVFVRPAITRRIPLTKLAHQSDRAAHTISVLTQPGMQNRHLDRVAGEVNFHNDFAAALSAAFDER